MMNLDTENGIIFPPNSVFKVYMVVDMRGYSSKDSRSVSRLLGPTAHPQ